MAVIYPLVKGDTYFMVFTQEGPDRKEHPIAFIVRYLTMTVFKYSILSVLVSIIA